MYPMDSNSDGLDSARLQEEEGTPESIMDFNNTKGSGVVGCDMAGSYGSNKGSLTGETVLHDVLLQHSEVIRNMQYATKIKLYVYKCTMRWPNSV